MDEAALIQEILDRMLDKAEGAKKRRVRVVNLSVYGKNVDPDELTRAFRTLTFNTIAQGANLHVRRCENLSRDSALDSVSVHPSLIRLDSLEMDEASTSTN